jgi:hypothetical protein
MLRAVSGGAAQLTFGWDRVPWSGYGSPRTVISVSREADHHGRPRRPDPGTRAGRVERENWTVGADAVAPRPWEQEWVDMPAGRLHAVSGDGLVAGRAVCLTPVTLLDPADWAWPDDGDHEWPLCWICLALTH